MKIFRKAGVSDFLKCEGFDESEKYMKVEVQIERLRKEVNKLIVVQLYNKDELSDEVKKY